MIVPNVLFFDDIMFVHAGIPRDSDIRAKVVDLAALNDPDLRFQMLWSDPSSADYIPADLQAQNSRFPFGRLQFEAFMKRIGCTMMVRGHEKVDVGTGGNFLTAIDPKTGRIAWRRPYTGAQGLAGGGGDYPRFFVGLFNASCRHRRRAFALLGSRK